MIEIKNKKAYFDYTILEELEAGIALTGTEIKSIRKGSIDLKDTFVNIKNNEAFITLIFILSPTRYVFLVDLPINDNNSGT